MAKLIPNGSMPMVMNGKELAYEARKVVLKAFDNDLEAIETSYTVTDPYAERHSGIAAELKVVVWGSQDIDTIKSVLNEMMEDEFTTTGHHVRHEEYATMNVYKVEIFQYIEEYFSTHKW